MSAVVAAFRSAAPPGAAHGDEDHELARALDAAIARGTEAHPGLAVEPTALARYLGGHADDERPPAAWLAARNLPDLYLACGVALGVPAAVAAFEARIVPALRAAVGRLCRDAEATADVVATVRAKLVVGAGDARGPRIADYGGHGELVVWARVIAIRAALDQLRAGASMMPADDHLWELAAPGADPAIALIKRESAALIKAAFHAGLAALTPRQRNLLRQHLLDDLTIDELGAIYSIHRVTAARWLAAARSDLWAHARKQLRETLALSDSAVGGMLDDIRSTLDLSIERALAG
jgi:RNA polymerase sigma-70 factor, ECF subfamily